MAIISIVFWLYSRVVDLQKETDDFRQKVCK
ncbi:MAG: hypothetical protein UW62_C0006G0002 [Candidatus Collierbacteria bacterium GW2011_GWB1_44_35]|uniref:Uncharacterized protein n=1 Tax=Candidatus Collierbacteria bacterium GW2011_GWB1_44_35 TaxID=1618383 RepID=A0A0G1J9I8_9BACT|nr:MAG: hypothetical protein UW62_C0006G0002 [Candidatus Collierbacteria bacterium GW2011_GWB1_44_35]